MAGVNFTLGSTTLVLAGKQLPAIVKNGGKQIPAVLKDAGKDIVELTGKSGSKLKKAGKIGAIIAAGVAVLGTIANLVKTKDNTK